MSPRPRKVSDDDVFAAAYRAMTRLSPSELTLAAIAAEAGVTAGALVQRFGSRRQLLLALSSRYSGGTAEMFAGLRQASGSPLGALRAYGECLSHLAASPATLARSLSYLQIDLTDPDFRKHLHTQATATRQELEALIDEAVREGELTAATDARRLGRLIEAVLSGSMMAWAHYQEGTAVEWMREDLEAVLAPFVVRRRSAPRRHASKSRRAKPSRPGRKARRR